MFDEANIEWTHQAWRNSTALSSICGLYVCPLSGWTLRQVYLIENENLGTMTETYAKKTLSNVFSERYNDDLKKGKIQLPVVDIPSSYEELDQSDDLHDDPTLLRRQALPSQKDCWDDADPF